RPDAAALVPAARAGPRAHARDDLRRHADRRVHRLAVLGARPAREPTVRAPVPALREQEPPDGRRALLMEALLPPRSKTAYEQARELLERHRRMTVGAAVERGGDVGEAVAELAFAGKSEWTL